MLTNLCTTVLALLAAALCTDAAALRGVRRRATHRTTVPMLFSTADVSFAGFRPSDAPGGLEDDLVQRIYGPAALARAKNWVQSDKQLWCGDASDPDADDKFPWAPPPAAETGTGWPGACPAAPKAQALFDAALASRMLFNDNEAACLFRAASRSAEAEGRPCAMAHLGAVYSMAPNVNYAQISSSSVLRMIYEELAQARGLLQSTQAGSESTVQPQPHPQPAVALQLYQGLRVFFCVERDGDLDEMLGMSLEQSKEKFQARSVQCAAEWADVASALSEQYPFDPNLNAIAAGALMQTPAWKWWARGSQTFGWNASSHFDHTGDDDHSASRALGATAAATSSASTIAIVRVGSQILPNAARANVAIERGLNVAPSHLGLLHFAVHNLEQGPAPRWAESVGDRLYANGGSSGHALHMRTHIDSRVGAYAKSYAGNIAAVRKDAEWNVARSGGGVMSVLYKYNPHNNAFAAEAAQHMGSWSKLAAALSSLNLAASFPLVADPSQGSLANFLSRQYYQPLRFGKYEEIAASTADGEGAADGSNSSSTYAQKKGSVAGGVVSGYGAGTRVRVALPGAGGDGAAGAGAIVHELPITKATAGIRSALGDVRLFARSVALARLGRPDEAAQALRQLIVHSMDKGCAHKGVAAANIVVEATGAPVCKRAAANDMAGTTGCTMEVVAQAEALGRYHIDIKAKKLAAEKAGQASAALDIGSASASGTLTIDNSDPLRALHLLVPAAEIAGAVAMKQAAQEALGHAIGTTSDAKEGALLELAMSAEKMLAYDEPAPFFYPVGETLAGYHLKQHKKQQQRKAGSESSTTSADNNSQGASDSTDHIQAAIQTLRKVLYKWPRSALASAALHEALSLGGNEATMAGAQIMVDQATKHNDTALDLAWL